MKITQVYELLNTVIGEVTGKTDLVAEDLSNVVDVGKEILGSDNMVDAYVKSLVNHIGKVILLIEYMKVERPLYLWTVGNMEVFLKKFMLICLIVLKMKAGI